MLYRITMWKKKRRGISLMRKKLEFQGDKIEAAMRKKLEFQGDRIEAVLSLHKVPVRVSGGTVTPRWVRFVVLPDVGVKISKIKALSDEIAAALGAGVCFVSRAGATVTIEVPRSDPQPIELLPLYDQLSGESANPIPSATAILGLAADGSPLLARLPSPDVAHILVAGTEGAGKTTLLRTMVLSLAMGTFQDRLNMVLISLGDVEGDADFDSFEGLPHLSRPVIRYTQEAVEVLQDMVRLMEERTSAKKPVTQPRVVIVIDKLDVLLKFGGRSAQKALVRLTQRGCRAGIHVVAAVQHPTTDVFGSLFKANFPVRLVGKVGSVEEARTATGWSGTGAERLLGKGDFVAIAEGNVFHFQAARVSPAEIREMVARLMLRSVEIAPPTTTIATFWAGFRAWVNSILPGKVFS